MRKYLAIQFVLFWFVTLNTAVALDKITIQVVNTAEAARKVQVLDVLCGNNVVFQDRLEPSQKATVKICADGAGEGSIITTLVGGCASAVTSQINNLVAGTRVNL